MIVGVIVVWGCFRSSGLTCSLSVVEYNMCVVFATANPGPQEPRAVQEWLCQPRSSLLWLLRASRSTQEQGE